MSTLMYLTKAMTAEGTGIAVEHHAITQVDMAADLSSLVLHISQWPNEMARIKKAEPSGFWRLKISADQLDLTLGLAGAVRAAVLAHPVFAGGAWAAGADASVATAKARQWASIVAQRDKRLAGTFKHAGKDYQINRPGMTEAVVDAMLAEAADEKGWTERWVLADNTLVLLTAKQMIAVGRAARRAVSELWSTSQALRDQLDAIDDVRGTLAEVAAVRWPE